MENPDAGYRADDLLTQHISTTEKLQFLQSLAYQSAEKDTVQAIITNLNKGVKVDMFDKNILSSRIVNITQHYENFTRGQYGPFDVGEEKTLVETFIKNIEVIGGHSSAANNLRTAIKRKQPTHLIAATDEAYLINNQIASNLLNIRNYFDINSLKRKRDDNDHESDVKAHNKRTKLVHDKSRKDQQNRSQSSATNKSKSIVCKTCGKGHQGTCMYIKEMNANHTNHEWLNSPAHIWFRDQHQSKKFNFF